MLATDQVIMSQPSSFSGLKLLRATEWRQTSAFHTLSSMPNIPTARTT